jgi:hypothetical protein
MLPPHQDSRSIVLRPLVRIPMSALPAIRLHHVASVIDPSLAVPEGVDHVPVANTLAGYTEWEGAWRGNALYASWDWSVVLGALVLISPHKVLTNIKLAEYDSEESSLLNRAHVLEWLDSLAWRDAVRAAIGADF